jgi:hypothetical protein
MKTTSLLFRLFIILIGGISLISCETTSDLKAGTYAALVTVEADGTTLINDANLKSLSTGSGTSNKSGKGFRFGGRGK